MTDSVIQHISQTSYFLKLKSYKLQYEFEQVISNVTAICSKPMPDRSTWECHKTRIKFRLKTNSNSQFVSGCSLQPAACAVFRLQTC